jgi:hypothetical protein
MILSLSLIVRQVFRSGLVSCSANPDNVSITDMLDFFQNYEGSKTITWLASGADLRYLLSATNSTFSSLNILIETNRLVPVLWDFGCISASIEQRIAALGQLLDAIPFPFQQAWLEPSFDSPFLPSILVNAGVRAAVLRCAPRSLFPQFFWQPHLARVPLSESEPPLERPESLQSYLLPEGNISEISHPTDLFASSRTVLAQVAHWLTIYNVSNFLLPWGMCFFAL